MNGTSYRQAFRARRFVIVATALLVMALAVLIPPAPVSHSTSSTALEDVASPSSVHYEATAVLGVPPNTSGGNAETQFKTVQFYLQSTAVGEAFAQNIHYTGQDLAMLGRLVTISADAKSGIFKVTGNGGNPQQAAAITNGFTSALHDYVSGLGTQASEQSIKQAQASVDGLKQRIDELSSQIDQLSETLPASRFALNPQVIQLQAQRDALISSYAAAYQHLTSVSAGGTTPTTAGLAILRTATAGSATKQSPSLIYGLWPRILLGLVVGLALGAALALLLEHNARKIFTRESAEQAFGGRVLAELPRQRLTGTAKDVVVISAPRSRLAEAYRMLRVLLIVERAAMNGDGAKRGGDHRPVSERPPHRVHVNGVEPSRTAGSTSPGEQGEFTSFAHDLVGSRNLALVVAATADEPVHPAVVANLAASFAESGRTVTVLRLGSSVRRGGSPGADREAPGTPTTHESSIDGVRVVEWAPEYGGPSAPAALQAVREDRAVVLVDAGRVATAEFAEIAPLIDGVVAVCQIGRTTIENAERTADIIAWSHAHLLGVVLAQVPAGPVERLTRRRRPRSPLTSREGMSPHTSPSGGSDRPDRQEVGEDYDEDAMGLLPPDGRRG
jgi:capsular polysaccharide biosynthesis protein